MFGDQGITSDSRMNKIIPDSDRQVVHEAAYLHFARVDITDHIQGRLRHFRAAKALGDLERFTQESIIYPPKIADKIAVNILKKHPQASEVASNFLLQCALRHCVAKVCNEIASGEKYEHEVSNVSFDIAELTNVHSFKEASERIFQILGLVDWDNLCSPVTKGKGVTQIDHRIPIDLGPFLKSSPSRKEILSQLGLGENAEV